MKYPVLKSLIVLLSFTTPLVIAAPETPKPTKSTVPLIDLGAEMKGKGAPGVKSYSSPSSSSSNAGTAYKSVSNNPSSAQAVKPTDAKMSDESNWSYSGETGPRYWADLSEENLTCKIGKNQSPVDLRDKAAIGTSGLPELDIRYRDVPLKVLNTGKTLQVDYPLGSYIKVGGQRYELMNFQFHTPSEHKKEGFNYPMEVQLVHRDGDGNHAIMAIIFQEGEENESLQVLLDNLPKQIGKQELHRNANLNPVMFMPGNTDFYKYSGSLTTPPCTEGVYWMVFKHPIEASAEQIQQMNEVMGENARPVQQMNARAMLKSWAEQMQEPPMYEFY